MTLPPNTGRAFARTKGDGPQAGTRPGVLFDAHPLRPRPLTGSATVLTPAHSSRRGKIVRRPFENSHTWICRTHTRKTRSLRLLFFLLGGEGQNEGER
jgi:hypothetical protein